MATGIIAQVGTITTLTKTISEADVALFKLVTDNLKLQTDEPKATDPDGHSSVPAALLAALLAAAAARHVEEPAVATFARAEVSFIGTASAEDTLIATAEVAGYDDASHTLRVRAHCATQEGKRLAEGTFEVRAATA